MLKNAEAYLTLSAMLRAREPKLLTSERAGRMLDAASFEEAAKLLTDCGYEDMSGLSAKQIDVALNAHRSEIYKEIDMLSPDSEVADIFKMKYDCHNAKVIIKSEAMNTDSSTLLSDAGRIPGVKLLELYNDEKYSEMPGMLGKAMQEAKSIIARTSNPQLADFALDKAYFTELFALAEETGNKYIKAYVKMLIDSANLKSAVRTLRMNKDADFMKNALIDGGNTETYRIIGATDGESLAALFAHTKLEKAAQLGAEAASGGSLTEFELECDNAVNECVKDAKLIAFGPEALTAYLAALESEITAIRMILTGRLAGVKSDIIKERLRELYA